MVQVPFIFSKTLTCRKLSFHNPHLHTLTSCRSSVILPLIVGIYNCLHISFNLLFVFMRPEQWLPKMGKGCHKIWDAPSARKICQTLHWCQVSSSKTSAKAADSESNLHISLILMFVQVKSVSFILLV